MTKQLNITTLPHTFAVGDIVYYKPMHYGVGQIQKDQVVKVSPKRGDIRLLKSHLIFNQDGSERSTSCSAHHKLYTETPELKAEYAHSRLEKVIRDRLHTLYDISRRSERKDWALIKEKLQDTLALVEKAERNDVQKKY